MSTLTLVTTTLPGRALGARASAAVRSLARRAVVARARLVRGLLWAVVAVCGGVYATSLAVPLWFDLNEQRLLVVTSGSMAPAFRAGDAVVLQDVAPSQLRVGQVVSFWPHGSDQLVTHRIEAMTTLPLLDQDEVTGRMVPVLDAAGRPVERDYLITRGDANAERDPDAVPLSRVRGVVLDVHRGWGTVLRWTTSTDGRLALLAPPLLALGAMEVRSMVVTRRQRPVTTTPSRPEVSDDLLLD